MLTIEVQPQINIRLRKSYGATGRFSRIQTPPQKTPHLYPLPLRRGEGWVRSLFFCVSSVHICGDWRFLNFVGVLRKLFPKHPRKIDIVQNDHVSVVSFVVVVLPAFAPPAK